MQIMNCGISWKWKSRGVGQGVVVHLSYLVLPALKTAVFTPAWGDREKMFLICGYWYNHIHTPFWFPCFLLTLVLARSTWTRDLLPFALDLEFTPFRLYQAMCSVQPSEGTVIVIAVYKERNFIMSLSCHLLDASVSAYLSSSGIEIPEPGKIEQ